MIAGAGGNIAVQVGPAGVILVDTGSAQASDKVLAAVQRLTSRRIRYIINTSSDADHVGGNRNSPKPARPSREISHKDAQNSQKDFFELLVPFCGEWFCPGAERRAAGQKRCIRSTARNSQATRLRQCVNATAVVAVLGFHASQTAAGFLAENIFPSLKRRGGRDVKKRCEATFERSGRGGQLGEMFRPEDFAEPTTPSAPLRWLRDLLLLAQPPLLFKEGKRANCPPSRFLDKHLTLVLINRHHNPTLKADVHFPEAAVGTTCFYKAVDG
jgi:hypothetical protein